jgi:hypothetical protein
MRDSQLTSPWVCPLPLFNIAGFNAMREGGIRGTAAVTLDSYYGNPVMHHIQRCYILPVLVKWHRLMSDTTRVQQVTTARQPVQKAGARL